MKVIVTGAAGFTGKYLVERLLDEGHDVIGVDLNVNPFGRELKWIQADVRNVKLPEADVLVHMAAVQYAGGTPDRKKAFYPTNVIGTKNIVREVKKRGIRRMIFVSTDMVYGLPEYLPVDEEHPYAPIGWYGKSKLAAEHIVTTNLEDWVILRPRLIAGPGRMGSLTLAFRLIEKGLPVPLPNGGKNVYQLVHVEDVVSAIILALDGPGGVYNIGSEKPRRMRELIRACDKKAKIIPFPKELVTIGLALPGFPLRKEQALYAITDYYVSIERAKEQLGWMPKHNDLDAIREAYKEYLKVRKTPPQK